MCEENIRLATFFEQVHALTDNVVSKLFSKWEEMYEFTEELQTHRLETIIEHLKDFYDALENTEEQKRVEMLNRIDNSLKNYRKLLKDLQISNEKDANLIHMHARGPPLTVFLGDISNSTKKYELIRDKRLEKMKSLRAKEAELCNLLELPPKDEFPNPIPSEQQLEDIESHILELEREKMRRMDLFKTSRARIMHLRMQMDYYNVKTEFEEEIISIIDKNFVPSGEYMEKLEIFSDSLEKKYERRIIYRTSLIQKLTKLWDRIKTDSSQREAFLSKWNSVQKSHFEAIKEEIKRCEEINLANIRPLVGQLREQIKMYWDLLTYTEEQKQEFKAYTTEHFSEDVLDLHELEVNRLQEYYEKYKHIFDLAEKRNQLWKRMLHLNEIAVDKNRLFNNRGGQLLKEEKERKTLEVNLPKVDKELKTALSDYHAEEGRPFLRYGVDFLEQITNEWEERIAVKECKKAIRDGLKNTTPRPALEVPQCLTPLSQGTSGVSPRTIPRIKRMRSRIALEF